MSETVKNNQEPKYILEVRDLHTTFSTDQGGKVNAVNGVSFALEPGKILGIKANVGQAVKRGDVVIILEAMKMENEIVAPSDGTVASINVAVGDSVESGATLITMN